MFFVIEHSVIIILFLYIGPPVCGLNKVERARVNTEYIKSMAKLDLLVPGRHINLLDTIGQGASYKIAETSI